MFPSGLEKAKAQVLVTGAFLFINNKKSHAMVMLKKISFSNEEVVYEYYPEGKTEFPGTIIVDLKERKVFLILKKSSQRDFYREIVGAELNDMRDRIHKMRVEKCEEPYTGEELSMCDLDKDDGGYVYAEKLYPNLKNFLKRMNAKINVWLLGIRKNDGT